MSDVDNLSEEELIEELRNKNAELRDELDKIGAELNKEKEKNINFREVIEVISNLNNNWVSKHKIKAKIEKLEDKIEILEELLEEEE